MYSILAYALIAAALFATGFIKGRESGLEAYFALVGSLAGHASQVKVVTKEVTRTRTEFRTKETAAAVTIGEEIANELKVVTAGACAIPDADRVRLTDRIADDFNEAIRMYPVGPDSSEKVSAPDDVGLGATGGPPIRESS